MYEKVKRFYNLLKGYAESIGRTVFVIVLGGHTEFPDRTFRCRLVDTMIELGIGVLIGAIIVGKVAIPQIIAVSTSGWDSYSVLLWGVIPLIIVASMGMAIIYHVKYGAWPR